MKPLIYFASTSKQVAQHPVELLKLEATINASASATLYLQIHDSNQTPAEGAVPVKSWPAGECGYKEFKRGELVMTAGCYVCLSSTVATKTLAVGASDKCDVLHVELTQAERITGTTFVGDTTTNSASRQIWSEAAGVTARKKLISVEVDASPFYPNPSWLMFFATDSPSNGDTPMLSLPIPANNALRTGANAFRFGVGLSPFQVNSTGSHYGCTLAFSSTPTTLTLYVVGGSTIKAEYK